MTTQNTTHYLCQAFDKSLLISFFLFCFLLLLCFSTSEYPPVLLLFFTYVILYVMVLGHYVCFGVDMRVR